MISNAVVCNSYNNDSFTSTKTSFDKSNIVEYIKSNGYDKYVEKTIMGEISRNEYGLRRLFLEIAEYIPLDKMDAFVNTCVVSYIIKVNRYGYTGLGLEDIYEKYYAYIRQESWYTLFFNIIEKFSTENYDIMRTLERDISTLSMYYFLSKSEELDSLFTTLCDAHEMMLTSNGQVEMIRYQLNIDDSINSLEDLVSYQIGEDYKRIR